MVRSNTGVSMRIIRSLAALVFLLCLPIFVSGVQAEQVIKIYYNGKQVSSDAPPFIDKNSRTMVPLRLIAEKMGAYVDWSMGTQIITIKNNGTLITLAIGSKQAVVDGKNVALDTQPVIRNSRTMIPLRFVGEHLGADVSWNIKEQAVYITMGDGGDGGDNENPGETVKEEIVVNVSSYANIRQGPGTSYPIITQVKNGTVLGTIGSSGGWYQVLLADNSRGWISGSIVKLKGDSGDGGDEETPGEGNQGEGPSKIDGDSVIFITDSVNIRTGPSTSYGTIGQANYGLELAALGEQNGWIKVRTADGKTGWVASWLVAYKQQPQGGGSAPLKGKVIVIDPGHGSLQSGGGADPGAVSPSGLYEKDVVTKIAAAAGEVLSQNGATVVYTRKGDTSITLEGRARLANNLGADAFVAIHCNSSTGSAGNGTSTYIYNPGTLSSAQWNARQRLAASVQNELIRTLGRKNLGVLQSNLAVLRCTTVPSILVETAFLSNSEEESLLRSSAFQTRAGKAVAEGLIDYFQ